eukprot:107762_1
MDHKSILLIIGMIIATFVLVNITIEQSHNNISIIRHERWQHQIAYTYTGTEDTMLPSLNETEQIGYEYWLRMTLNATHRTEIPIHRMHVEPTKNIQNSTGIPFYIFQIGFNKCGTRTLTQFFRSNHIRSAHWLDSPGHHWIHHVMIGRYLQNAPILIDYYRQFMFYADFDAMSEDASGILVWQILFQQYKNSKFILNIRDINHWLKSRYLHLMSDRRPSTYCLHCFYVDWVRIVTNSTLSDVEILNQWAHNWYTHHCNVIQFFKRMNASHNLLIFDVENDSISTMIGFFNGFNLRLNGSYWGYQGKTMDPERFKSKQITKWKGSKWKGSKWKGSKWKQITNKHQKLLSKNHKMERLKSKQLEMKLHNQTEKWKQIANKYPKLLSKNELNICNEQIAQKYLINT